MKCFYPLTCGMSEIPFVVQAQKYLVCAFFFPSQVKLYKSENLDNPIHTVNLGLSLFFHFPPLLRDGEVRILLNKISLGHFIFFSLRTLKCYFWCACSTVFMLEWPVSQKIWSLLNWLLPLNLILSQTATDAVDWVYFLPTELCGAPGFYIV